MANKKSINNSKKNKKKVNSKKEVVNTSEITDFDSNVWHHIRVGSIIIIIFCLFYFVTFLITRDDTKKEEDNTNTDSGFSYSEIMVGRSFSIDEGDYYVLYYDFTDDETSSTYRSMMNTYKGKENSLAIYSVNMGEGLNKKYVSDASNPNPTSAAEIKINGPTLIHFSNHNVVEYIEGEDAIRGHLE